MDAHWCAVRTQIIDDPSQQEVTCRRLSLDMKIGHRHSNWYKTHARVHEIMQLLIEKNEILAETIHHILNKGYRVCLGSSVLCKIISSTCVSSTQCLVSSGC